MWERKFDVTLRVYLSEDEDDSEESILSYLEGLNEDMIRDNLVDIVEIGTYKRKN